MSPKQTEEKIRIVINAWETLRPTKSFAGMTLAQSKAKTQASFDTRAALASLDNQILAEQNKRDNADEVSLATVQLIVNAVKGDPEEGEDGELYEAMGYTRKSERASGLRRGKPADAAAKKS